MVDKISSRQLYFFLACVAPVGKLILLPPQLVEYAKNDLLLPAATHLLLQAGTVFCLMLLSRSNKTAYDLLADTFGKVVARILCGILSLFFFYLAVPPVFEQKLLVQSVFYDTLPSFLVFAPFFLLSAYLCSKPLASFGRIWDILAPLSIVGFFGIIVFALGEGDFAALLPVGASGAAGIAKGTAFSASYFYDTLLVLCLVGRFDYQKGMAWKATLFYCCGGLAVLFFLALFYAVFSDIALRQTFAFAKMTKYFAGITLLGRIDYFFICLLSLVMAFYCAMPLQACTACLKRVCGGGSLGVYSAVVNGLMLLVTFFLNYQFRSARQFLCERLFWLYPLFCLAVPLALCLIGRYHEKIRNL